MRLSWHWSGILLLWFVPLAIAQSDTSPEATKDEIKVKGLFRNLTDRRNELDNQVREAEQEVDNLNRQLTEIQHAKESLSYYAGLGKTSKEKSVGSNEARLWRETLAQYPAEEVVKKQLDAAKAKLLASRKELTSVESEIDDLLNIEKPRQDFKKQLSIAFAALVGVVILGFYVIAFRYAKVRESIFSGDSALQFITLFSLVIAIILFGLTEVLQGRELAALLGGISGYILGRSRSKQSDTKTSSEAAEEADSDRGEGKV